MVTMYVFLKIWDMKKYHLSKFVTLFGTKTFCYIFSLYNIGVDKKPAERIKKINSSFVLLD